MSRFSRKAIDEMLQNCRNPSTPAQENRAVLQLQRQVAAQQKLIDDLSSALTRLQQQLYVINHKLHQN